MGSLGFSEILVVLILALVVFGPNRLPGIARQIGRALGELRKVSGQFQEEIKSSLGLDDNFPYARPLSIAAKAPELAEPPPAESAPEESSAAEPDTTRTPAEPV